MTEPKMFPTAVLLSVTSGKMLCDTFGDVQFVGDYITGQSTFTHMYASKNFWHHLRDVVVTQHPWMGDEDTVFADYPDLDKVRASVPDQPEDQKNAVANAIWAWLEDHVYPEHGRELPLLPEEDPEYTSFWEGMPKRFRPGGEDDDKIIVIGV